MEASILTHGDSEHLAALAREEGHPMTTVGSGSFTYRLIQDWAKLPPGETFGVVSAVATDSRDNVYVYQRKDPPVVVFDRDGNYLRCWGIGAITDPHGFYIANDIVYLTDRQDSVVLTFTLDGKPLQVIGKRGVHSDTGCERPGDLVPRAAGPFNYPTELVPAPSGDLYVSDGYRNARVHRFTAEGQLVQSWGEPGKTAPNQFHLPHSILAGADGRIYVCDRENSRIQIFSADGRYLAMWTDIHRPTDIAVDRDGLFYVSELEHEGTGPRISILDRDGKVLARWASRSAHGLWVDSRGDIYLALTRDKSVDKYVRQR
jgi:DNA-binding beta-propeller fold protein YncE